MNRSHAGSRPQSCSESYFLFSRTSVNSVRGSPAVARENSSPALSQKDAFKCVFHGAPAIRRKNRFSAC